MLHRPRSVLAAALAVVALLAGCVAPKVQSTPEAAPSTAPSGEVEPEGEVPTTLDAFYAQEIAWEECGSFECATVRAPLDWDDPAAGAIELAVQRSTATGADPRGSLLINPGGPGSSSIEFLPYAVGEVIGADVLEAYDVVAWDPRGVGASSPVSCGSDAVVDEFLTSDVPFEDQDDVEAARAAVRSFGEACLEDTGPLLGEVDTVSSARDLDLLRALLGDETLTYLGFSYGTFLGATYAELFPERVGRLVLDGAIDPTVTNDELVLGQAEGFEDALRAYVEDCQLGAGCPLSGDADEGMAQIAALVERIGERPLPTSSGEEVGSTLGFLGILVTLYDDASWSFLTMALEEALREGTGDTLLQLANFYLDRTPDGRYTTNAMIAFTAINCLDYPAEVRTFEQMTAFAEEVAEVAPTFGETFALGVGCEAWPVPATGERGPIAAAGAAPIVVVGTTGDPATPYEWSIALADQLESGVLVTWEGEGHTAYGRSNACVEDAVDAYLLEGTVPEDGLTC